ncbi:class I SAM-dependent methyltransferase [Sciscionella marina]|uniref:class I SAM-dependent methyltransferase n=1 Tax=Sciscionella marina TaxID=508770 RepID=UPI00058F8EE1|nr:class I SAM-dependent methyltransferase [Sciscionella marina]
MHNIGDDSTTAARCHVCDAPLSEFVDFGKQPLSDAFVRPDGIRDEFFFRLAVGFCPECTMVQLMDEVPRERMFNAEYPYLSSGSAVMREHFRDTAREFLGTELNRSNPFIVELGCNDGAMLATIADAGVRHLGMEPCSGVAELARGKGIQVRSEFFEYGSALDIREGYGPADVIYAANTLCHIPYMDSILRGVDALLADDGVFVFEDPYFADILERTSFDQIYDEHFFFFSARSVRELSRRHGLELVDVRRLHVHGGEVRYTLARTGRRVARPSVAELIEQEWLAGVADPGTLDRFRGHVETVRSELRDTLEDLHDRGKRVVGYGATAKSATVVNYCGIGTEWVPFVCDSTPAKQGKLMPGSHIPVQAPEEFGRPFPDYALLFAWNHAEEIMANEREFRTGGGQWLLYVPRVHLR